VPGTPSPSPDVFADTLFSPAEHPRAHAEACPGNELDARVPCFYARRFGDDTSARLLAIDLWTSYRVVVGVEESHVMDGGYRGRIRIEPAVPRGAERKHLAWVSEAFHDFDTFFAELKTAPSAGAAGSKNLDDVYRWKALTLRFMRSAAPARTPAAYAHDWTVAYNLVGTLNTSADRVRETMFHEVFHLNDAAHGDFSSSALAALYAGIVKRCGAQTACLTPYAPSETQVRGGTYYAFQPGNGVSEYAAELALRYYREQRASLRGLPNVTPFKCGPPENGRAWALLRDEFFAGKDNVAACSPPPGHGL
jgi:hypothetical protein